MPKLKLPEIRKPQEIDLLKCLIFGDAGVGKTHFLGTAHDDPVTHMPDSRVAPLLILDFEGGTSTLSGLDIDVMQVRDWDDYRAAHDWLSRGDHGYKSVAIDSVSETHGFALQHLLDIRPDDSRSVEDLSDLMEYGRALVQLRRFLREFRDLPMHVFYTSHVKDEKDPREGMVKKPSLAGKAANEVLGVVSVAAYMCYAEFGKGEDKEQKRVMVLKNYPKIRAKARTPWMSEAPNEIIEPSMGALFDALGIK